MRLFCALFDNAQTHGNYERMWRVWEYSANKNSPCNGIDTQWLESPVTRDPRRVSFDANYVKLKAWVDYCDKYPNEDIVLMDADTVVLRHLCDVFKRHKFACGFTIRDGAGRLTINGGVVYVRKGQDARDIMTLWQKCDEKLYKDPKLHQRYRSKYAGMNQSSWGYMMEKHRPKGIIELPCSMYNRVTYWSKPRETPYVIHLKDTLRHSALGKRDWKNCRYGTREYVKLWRKYEKETLACKSSV